MLAERGRHRGNSRPQPRFGRDSQLTLKKDLFRNICSYGTQLIPCIKLIQDMSWEDGEESRKVSNPSKRETESYLELTSYHLS